MVLTGFSEGSRHISNIGFTLICFFFSLSYCNFAIKFSYENTFSLSTGKDEVRKARKRINTARTKSFYFPEKNFQIFSSKYVFLESIFRYVFFLQADGFLCNGSSIPSPFHAHNCSFAMFSCFSREKLFSIQKRILRVNFLHISDLFSYKQMVFSAIEARFCGIFMRTIAILPGFSTFSKNSRTRLRYK